MSQVRRQVSGDLEHHPYHYDYQQQQQQQQPQSQPQSQSQPRTSPSPSAARNPPFSPTSLTGNLIPRDYLGSRSDGQQQALRSGFAANAAAAPRKPPAPSPLQTSVKSYSPRADGSGSSQSPLSSRSPDTISPFQNQPPTSRIAHAAFPIPPSTASRSASSNTAEVTDRNLEERYNQYDKSRMERLNHNKLRTLSETTTDSIQSSTSSPISPAGSPQPMPGERSGQRILPRTSSIDSAISSLSSVSQPHKSTFDASALSQADIGNLIAAAGSPEAVIVHLLKEKHHAASQNSQLWKLVDKQRKLILGLNKDLERALKEKERHKKKVKELQTSAPPVPSVDSQTITLGADDGNAVRGQTDSSRAPERMPGIIPEPLKIETRTLHNTSEAEKSYMNASPHPDQQRANNVAGLSQAPALQDSQSPKQYSQQHPSATSPRSFGNYSSPAHDSPSGELALHPTRKPPPAPLKLEQVEREAAEHTALYDSDSEYEDILAVDELPIERGRRKTRGDDDRDREAVSVNENQHHSTSGKRKPQPLEIPGDSDELNDSDTVPTERPSRSRQGTTQSPPLADRSGSLASILSPRLTQKAPFSDRPANLAPKSPGLPMSPRPEDRPLGSPMPRMPREVPREMLSEIPNSLSSMPMSSGAGHAGLALTPRPAMHQTPVVPGTPGAGSFNPVDPANRSIPSIDTTGRLDSPKSPDTINSGVYRGLASEDYPNLLLPPNALPSIQVKVSSSRLRPSRNSYMAPRTAEEEPVFTLSVFSRSENSELWRVEKVIAALPQLDQQMRQTSSFSAKLPDRSVFSGHSPAKVDARRAALNSYFEALLDTPMNERAALTVCQFLSSDAIEARDDETSLLKGTHQGRAEILRGPDGKPRKEGYLTKRGKNFGGWKARYFILHGPELKYFESPGGAHLGTIKLYSAQIGKQSQNSSAQNSPSARGEDDSENQYRHAFLILEPKKKDSSALVRHVLCAESDEERDTWVDALLEYVDGHSENDSPSQTQGPEKQVSSSNFKAGSKRNDRRVDSPETDGPDTVQGFSFDSAVAAEPPVIGPTYDKQPPKSPHMPPGFFTDSTDTSQDVNLSESGQSHPPKMISGPTNGAVIQNAGAWGNKAAIATPTSTKEKKRSIWGFRTRSSMDLASQLQASHEASLAQVNTPIDRGLVRPVFGIPLAEAVHFCPPQGVDDADLPAVVYRCIEYLEAKGAASEEGIFRLSGSNVVVKALKERFNTEGDVDFFAGDQYYDVHAVASLFKQYLRELPSTVLTRELHLDFLRVLELDERQKKIAAFNFLVHRLPKPNLALLRALSQFLIAIVNNSDVNKMTVRNVGIVFAPTLNIPAPVFSMFLTDFDSIFGEPRSESALGSTAERVASPEHSRSPRHPVFPDITTTPGYHQTTFRRNQDLPESVPEEYSAHNDAGLVAARPNYRQSSYVPESYSQSQPSSPSINRMLSPTFENPRSSKAQRRESSLLFMEAGHHNSSFPTSRDDQNFVDKNVPYR